MLPNIHATSIGFAMNLSSLIPISPRKKMGKQNRHLKPLEKYVSQNTLDVLRDIPLTFFKLPFVKNIEKTKAEECLGSSMASLSKSHQKER